MSNVQDIVTQLNNEVQVILSDNFNVGVSKAYNVPATDDAGLTYANLDLRNKKTQTLETCVLFIDMRRSTEISLQHDIHTLSKLYSAFVRAMIKASQHFGGKVRNIIGDRVLVLFDKNNCVVNAVNTAYLLNTVSTYVVNKYFTGSTIECGIGVDYGEMLVAKTGVIKKGVQNSDYRSLVWLGKPANIASKLTDLANKEFTRRQYKISYKSWNPLIPSLGSIFLLLSPSHALETNGPTTLTEIIDEEEFLEKVGWDEASSRMKYGIHIVEKMEVIQNKFKTQPILITDTVYEQLTNINPKPTSIANNWWSQQDVNISKLAPNLIYGTDLIYKVQGISS